MAVHTTKNLSERDSGQTLQSAYNDVDATISTNGFLVGKVGHKVEAAISTTNVPNDTVTYTYYDSSLLLYQIEIIYADGTRQDMISAERIA